MREPAHQKVPVRACPVGPFELPGQGEAIEICQLFEIVHSYGILETLLDEIGASPERSPVQHARTDTTVSSKAAKGARKFGQKRTAFQVAHFNVDVFKTINEDLLQSRVGGNGIGKMRQAGDAGCLKSCLNVLRLNINHAVLQTALCSGAAVMQFIGMNDDDLSGQRCVHLATIAEGLNTTQRQTDCIGVVPVRVEPIAPKTGFYPLDLVFNGRYPD